jgi:hypothetical protein
LNHLICEPIGGQNDEAQTPGWSWYSGVPLGGSVLVGLRHFG